jgi:hypothetical protein
MALTFIRARSAKKRGGEQEIMSGDEWFDAVESGEKDPEETAVFSVLAALGDELFREVVPEKERRALLYELDGHSVAEIAALEGISPSTVQERCKRARAKLEAAAEERGLRAFALPIAWERDAGWERPPREVVERGWQRFQAAIGREPESEPPSGPRRVVGSEPPPSSSSAGGWLRALGPFAGLLFAVSLVLDTGAAPPLAAVAGVDGAHPVARVVPVSAPGALPVSTATAGADGPPEPAPGAVQRSRSLSAPPAAPARRAVTAADVEAMDRVRRLLMAEDVAGALRAFDDPEGRGNSWRQARWADLCAEWRRAHPDGTPEMEKRCPPR